MIEVALLWPTLRVFQSAEEPQKLRHGAASSVLLKARDFCPNRHRSDQEGRGPFHQIRWPRLRADQDEHLVRDFACSPAVALAYKPDTGLGNPCRPDGELYREQRKRSFRFASRPVLRAVAAYTATAWGWLSCPYIRFRFSCRGGCPGKGCPRVFAVRDFAAFSHWIRPGWARSWCSAYYWQC